MASLKVKKSTFGILSDGREVALYTVSNGKMSFSAMEYGCTLTSIILPKKNGQTVDALLGFSTFDGWVNDGSCFGTVVGRFANRIGGSAFTLNGKEYQLDKNDGENCLHSGFDRYEKKMWSSKIVKNKFGAGVEFTRISYDGEQGFPGEVKLSVTYTLNEKNELSILYKALSDQDTPINLTNHAYFNLKGYNGGDVSDQIVEMNCSKVLEVSDVLIPTGKYLDVKGTCFDFTKPKKIGQDMGQTAHGYDHCFCIDDYDGTLKQIAKVTEPESGLSMTVKTTLPGVQMYTANFMTGVVGKNGFPYKDHGAYCFETQFYPDAPNKPEFPSCIAKKGEEFTSTTQYIFSC